MEYHFCTIATANYLPHAIVLHHSLQMQSQDFCLHVLFIGTDTPPPNSESLRIYSMSDIINTTYAAEIITKYENENDHLRWGLKPVFLSLLLKEHDKVIYTDVDIFFFQHYDFIFDQLAAHSILVTPHWAPYLPLPHTEDFELNYKIGLFNAGFLAVSKAAMPALRWWTELCLFKMSKDFSSGYFVDQRYLDMLFIIDEKAGVLRHQGCNVGGWNIHQNKRSLKNGEVFINNKYPVIFIHFNQSTFEQIAQGHDPLLKNYLVEYRTAFTELGYNFDELKPEFKERKQGYFTKLKRGIRLRTRIKGLLFTLYRKI